VARTLSEMITRARGTVAEIAPEPAADALREGAFKLILDVREPAEFRELHLRGATCVPRGVLELRADPASPSADAALADDRSARILVYCTRAPGARSLLAAQTLNEMGFDGVEVLAGGLNAWSQAGLPVEGDAAAQTGAEQ
jgi:rhodanese-related sulfurtransferase